MSNTAIILAAGNGTRMKADKSKLLLEINNMTVIERTVKTFSSIDEIDNIIVVVRENDIPLFKDVLLKYNVTYCIGGNSRQESVSNAVKVIDACDLQLLILPSDQALLLFKRRKYLSLINMYLQ